MKIFLVCFTPLIVLLTALFGTFSSYMKNENNFNPYFPVNNSVTLVYKSSFGECTTRYFRDNEFIISLSESDRFKYRQVLIIKDDGVYASEVYQYYKIFLFIKKESTLLYGKPLLRFPLPLTPGLEWVWEGNEIEDGDTTLVKVTGKSFNKEIISTKAGSFEAIKVETIVEGSSNTRNRVTEWYVEGVGLIKAKIIIEGGGMMGFLRDILGYSTIDFNLSEIKKL